MSSGQECEQSSWKPLRCLQVCGEEQISEIWMSIREVWRGGKGKNRSVKSWRFWKAFEDSLFKIILRWYQNEMKSSSVRLKWAYSIAPGTRWEGRKWEPLSILSTLNRIDGNAWENDSPSNWMLWSSHKSLGIAFLNFLSHLEFVIIWFSLQTVSCLIQHCIFST